MLLIFGLGNPGSGHADNRHNIGFMAVDEIVRRHGFSAPRARFQSETFDGVIDDAKIMTLKPNTFMNNSGDAVGAAMRYYKLTPADVLVIHDEIDLDAGRIKVKTGGGSAGHNGIRSIAAHIGPDFRRLRMGVAHPGDKEDVIGHVLNNFSKSDKTWLEPLLDAIADALPLLVSGDEPGFMTKVALLTRPVE
ncbi:MAG: aminoacyl-tRNA hydrolase [Alphaproteobacteria bacterium]